MGFYASENLPCLGLWQKCTQQILFATPDLELCPLGCTCARRLRIVIFENPKCLAIESWVWYHFCHLWWKLGKASLIWGFSGVSCSLTSATMHFLSFLRFHSIMFQVLWALPCIFKAFPMHWGLGQYIFWMMSLNPHCCASGQREHFVDALWETQNEW